MSELALPPNYHNFLKDFILSVLEKNPDDLLEYAATYFKSCKAKRDRKRRQSTEEKLASYGMHLSITKSSEDMESEDLWLYSPRGRRKAVAAPSFDPKKIDRQSSLTYYDKTKEDTDFLTEALKTVLLFRSCNAEQLSAIVGSMFSKKVSKGETIITQGENGDNFYLIGEGKFVFHIEVGDYCIKKTLHGEGSFGELALLYECPRTATVIAATDGALWCLDQCSFKIILVTELAETHKMFDKIIRSSKVLSTLTFEERTRLVDALQLKEFEDGIRIIRQHEEASCMYFLVEGQVKVTDTTGEVETEIVRMLPGDNFGELALATKGKRQANVLAAGRVTCAVLELEAFERLLGPYRDILRRNVQAFNKERERAGAPAILLDEQR